MLHALIERVGNQGVHTYTDLRSYLPDVTPAQRRKRVLATGLPHRPGVYLFRGPSGEVLYVGTAVDLRRRVDQYFNGADPRGRMKEMVALATARRPRRMRARAGGRGARAAAAGRTRAAVQPPLAVPAPLVVGGADRRGVPAAVGGARTRATTARIGPFRSRADAADTAALLARFTGVRTCTTRLARSAPTRAGLPRA